MAVWAKNAKIVWLVVSCITVNMVYMQDRSVIYRVFFVPAALLTLVAARFYQIISDGSL